MNNKKSSILIFHSADVQDSDRVTTRGFKEKFKSAAARTSEVSVMTLQKNMQDFLTSVDTVIGNSPKNIGNLELQEIEIHAQIDGKGNIGISAIAGVEVGVQGGIKFILRKKV